MLCPVFDDKQQCRFKPLWDPTKHGSASIQFSKRFAGFRRMAGALLPERELQRCGSSRPYFVYRAGSVVVMAAKRPSCAGGPWASFKPGAEPGVWEGSCFERGRLCRACRPSGAWSLRRFVRSDGQRVPWPFNDFGADIAEFKRPKGKKSRNSKGTDLLDWYWSNGGTVSLTECSRKIWTSSWVRQPMKLFFSGMCFELFWVVFGCACDRWNMIKHDETLRLLQLRKPSIWRSKVDFRLWIETIYWGWYTLVHMLQDSYCLEQLKWFQAWEKKIENDWVNVDVWFFSKDLQRL